MLNCKQAGVLMSQGMEKKLRLPEKIRLNFHLLMCSGCRNFSKQMMFLRQGCQKFTHRDN